MNIGEVWIEKQCEEDETPEALKIIAYLEDGYWTVVFGEIEDDEFIEDEDDVWERAGRDCDVHGDVIYSNYIKYSGSLG